MTLSHLHVDDDPNVDPRILRTRRVVLTATIDLVAEQGCDGATVDAVSERAKVSRTTIYRHWPQRSKLLLDAFRALIEQEQNFDTGDLRTDLVELMSWINEFIGSSRLGAALASLIEAARRQPELAEVLDLYLDERRSHARIVFKRAIDRGELPADSDIDTALIAAVAPVLYASLVRRVPLTRSQVEVFVDCALAPWIRAPGHVPESSIRRGQTTGINTSA